MKKVKMSDIKIKRSGVTECPECKQVTPVTELGLDDKKVVCLNCQRIFEIKD